MLKLSQDGLINKNKNKTLFEQSYKNKQMLTILTEERSEIKNTFLFINTMSPIIQDALHVT